MLKFYNILKKDFILLVRDKIGLILLFIMPAILVVIMTMLQDSTFKAIKEDKINIFIINNDKKIIGNAIISGLDSLGIFNVTVANDTITEYAQEIIDTSDFKIVIVIPPKTSRHVRKKISAEIKKQLPSLTSKIKKHKKTNAELNIYFDPIITNSFKNAVLSSVNLIIANVKTEIVFRAYVKTLAKITGKRNENNFPDDIITVKEKIAINNFEKQKLPNSSEHNVPAWTVFAIFFIVIPLTSRIIYEKNEGTLFRLQTIPVHYSFLMISKILLYSCIAVLQAAFLIIIGAFLLPLINLPVFLLTTTQIISFLVFTFFVGVAASAYSVLISSKAETEHQAAIFGSLSVVILAAIGGIWVPVYIMSTEMQFVSSLSPLNWAINAYYDIVLKQKNLIGILPQILKLIIFSAISLILATKKRNLPQ
jgi:ABC-2 type transport system permease protein